METPSTDVTPKRFSDMTDHEFRVLLKKIIVDSMDTNEVQDRLENLGYPYAITITAATPDDSGLDLYFTGLGGLYLKSGDMVMAYMAIRQDHQLGSLALQSEASAAAFA